MVDRELLERLAGHAGALSNADTTHEQRNAAAVDATAARAALTAQAEEVALLREWYAADQEMDAVEELLRTPPEPGEIRSNGAFGRAQKRKWASEDAIRTALATQEAQP